MHRETWIFGYGSLIWRPAFRFEQMAPGYITGWARRFWQGSIDHRGVPGAPGRVVTLIPEPGARCWGVAYRVAAADLDEVLRALDHREQGGYVRHDVPLTLADPALATTRTATVYVATPDNPHYLGAAPLADIAAQVLASRGPSGSNVEYVLRLAEALAAMGAEDEHVAALAALVRRPAPLTPSRRQPPPRPGTRS
ncbi:gamma-glutamyl cyclotransferase [Sorangium cellulosum]|uniref:glutathione-specific gamma-glutamylcyclotransferase n=1 Tax=Sorangium cellulosum TaxID=56 RepID=A0A4P2Q190_SORCE|nr:gamma-glutamylcyclotransferase [Sorangium cellulosum]AUX22950.1 gamma-glutamyl cyclotransferase [Sorangium cellulosum]